MYVFLTQSAVFFIWKPNILKHKIDNIIYNMITRKYVFYVILDIYLILFGRIRF